MSIAKVLVRTSRRVFVTADTHFGHAEAISKFARRHRDADAMDEAMIAAINEVVGAKDILVHLGDFSGPRAWGTREFRNLGDLRARIACRRIHLVRGNHDPVGEERFDGLFEGVEDIVSARGIGGVDERVVLFHYPIEQWQGRPNGGFHLHGHVHGHGGEVARRCDVGIDVAAHRGRPVALVELLAQLGRSKPTGWVRVH